MILFRLSFFPLGFYLVYPPPPVWALEKEARSSRKEEHGLRKEECGVFGRVWGILPWYLSGIC